MASAPAKEIKCQQGNGGKVGAAKVPPEPSGRQCRIVQAGVPEGGRKPHPGPSLQVR